jgi:hypothetical protein
MVQDMTQPIEVPVLTFVRKVLEGMYNGKPLYAPNSSLLGKAIEHAPFAVQVFDFPQLPTPGDKITVLMSHRLAARYKEWGGEWVFRLGSFFEKEAQMLMIFYVTAQVRCGRSTVDAIRDFYALYGIDEDDYGEETAVKLLYRHTKNK